MARDVFISHSAQDKTVAETICGALEEATIRCWVAPRDVRPGRSFPGEITRAIQQSKVMLLIFSKHSNSSEQVLREVQLAVDSHLPIVRLRIEDVTLSDDLRYYLSTPQYLDALTPPLSKHVPRVETAIRELLEQSAEESEKAAAASPSTPVEAVAKNRASAIEEKSQINWKPFAILAGVLFASALAILALRLGRNTDQKGASAATQDAAKPTATATAQPAVTVVPQTTSTPVAIAVAQTPSPPAHAQPSEPAAPEMNKKGPLPRNNRTWQAWMDEFVQNFIASGESNDSDLALSFYAPKVDLFEEGWKTSEAIRRDVETYNARWPKRRNTVRGDVRLSEKVPNRTYAANFEHDYYVENPARGEWINGAAAVDLLIAISDDGIPRVISEKQKTLRKEKGTMQPR